MDTAIIGGGFSGLYAAWRLSQHHRLDLFEGAETWGGLAGRASLGPLEIDKYYHFICRSDRRYLQLIDELGLSESLSFRQTSTGFFYRGRLYPFSSPADLLRFRPLGLFDRLRFGLLAADSRHARHWRRLDAIPARDWLVSRLGPRGYAVIWEPLLKMKFGKHHEKVSAAWIWHRIHRVARSRDSFLGRESFGALEGETAAVVEGMLAGIGRTPARLLPGTAVESIASEGGAFTLEAGGRSWGPYRAVLSTVPFPVLASLLRSSAPGFARRLGGFGYIAVRCLTLLLNRSLTPCFWLNIHDDRIPFNGIIEMTNLRPVPGERPLHVLYIPAYVPEDHELFRMPEAEFTERFVAALPLVNPAFGREWVEASLVSRDRFAQPVCTVGTGERIPGVLSPLPGLFLTESYQIYPEDRTLSGMAVLADRAVGEMRAFLA